LYQQCTHFCHFSEQETFGNVVLEALSFGNPSFCLDKASMPEIIKSHHNGLILPSDKPTEMAKVLFQFINHSDYTTLSKNALQTAITFSQEKTINTYIQFFEEMLEAC